MENTKRRLSSDVIPFYSLKMKISKEVSLGKEFFGEKSIILAKSGYGKSYTARVILEEGVAKGHTFVVVDPQNAYLNIPEFTYINANEIEKVGDFAKLLADTCKNVVISTRTLTIEEQNIFLNEFVKEFRRHRKKGIQTIVIDEIHKFAPEKEKTISKNEVRGMFQEDRSYGQGVIGISQRPARMDKTILSQADNIFMGRVTSAADKKAISNYLDNSKDIEKIAKLEKGEFFIVGFSDENIVTKIRKAKTEHSGDSPTNLLNEDSNQFQLNLKKVVKTTMTGKSEMKDVVDKVVPSRTRFSELARLGAKVSIGAAISGLGGGFVNARFPIPNLPVVSTRTLASAGTTMALFGMSNFLPNNMSRTRDVMKYATAGSAVFTAGSLTWDLIKLSGIKMPNIFNAALTIATGATPMMQMSEQPAEVDLNTKYR